MKKLSSLIEGAASITLGSICISYTHMLAKVFTFYGLNSLHAMFIRSFGGLVILTLISGNMKAFHKIKNLKIWALRGISGALAIVCLYSAIQIGNYANANAINNTYPIFVSLFAFFLLGEKLDLKKILAMIVAFAGVFLIATPDLTKFSLPELLSIISAILSAIAITSVKFLRHDNKTTSVVLSFFLFSTLFSSFSLPSISIVNLWNARLFVISLVIVSTLGQLLITHGFKKSDASAGSILLLFGIIWGNLFGAVVILEKLSTSFWLGSFLILLSGISLNLKLKKAENT